MELRKALYPILSYAPQPVRGSIYSESWLKENVRSNLRQHEEALAIKTHPIPYVELQIDVENLLPTQLQIFGVHVEIWLGKPVIQFSTFVSESLRPGEKRTGMNCISFLNSFQTEILNPTKKDSVPPNVMVIYTLSCRNSLGIFEKTVKSTWVAPVILPKR
jgi:hypothetical protein